MSVQNTNDEPANVELGGVSSAAEATGVGTDSTAADIGEAAAQRQEKDENDSPHNNGHEIGVDETDPYTLHVWMDERPVTWFCVFCWLYLLTFIILVPLVVSFGNDVIYFTTRVPMYMRSHITRQRQDALVAGWDEADYELESEIGTTQQETPADVRLQLIFISKRSSGIIRDSTLTSINEIVDHIYDTDDFENYCQRIYNDDGSYQCRRPSVITHFFDEDWFKGSVNQTYDVEPTERNFNAFVRPSLLFNTQAVPDEYDFSDDNLKRITQYWAEYGEGTLNETEEYGQGEYDGRELPALFYFVRPDGSVNQLSNVFESLSDTKFGVTPNSTFMKATLCIINFGYPLEGYDSDNDRLEKQDDEISEWLFENLNEYFFSIGNKKRFTREFTMRWGCCSMSSEYLNAIIVTDMSLLIVTIFSVWLYTVYTLKSFFLACFAMIMIFLNFVPAILLYRYVSQIKYFGTLNMLSIFIILSIGADDVFVLCDTWEQTRADSPDGNRAKRLTFTMKHAAKVMFTTSISTIFSFIGNTSSLFPAVYTFGGFAAWLVWVNYCGVVLFFPSILILHDEYFWTPTAKYPWCITKQCVAMNSPGCCVQNMNAMREEHDRKRTLAEQRKSVAKRNPNDTEDRRKIDLWFENTLHTFIVRWRLLIIALFTIFFAVFLAFAAQLVPDPDPPQFFPDGNNYYELSYYFGSADNLRVKNEIVIGIEGINRRGTDEAIADDIGKPVWYDDFNMSDPQSQQFVAQFCDDLLCEYNDYDCRYPDLTDKLAITRPSDPSQLDSVRCWITAYREWAENDPDAILNATQQQQLIDEYNLPLTQEQLAQCNYGEFPSSPYYCYNTLLGYVWIADDLPASNPDYRSGSTNYGYWSSYFGAQYDEETADGQGRDVIIRFNTIEAELDLFTTTDYRDGIKAWENWDKYIERWLQNQGGAVSNDRYDQDFVDSSLGVQEMWFTDTRVWSYFYVQRRIIYESLTGIALSLSLAFAVLVAATGNWIIAVMAILTITQLVILVIGFTVIQGYKLGVMEAIIFVMVVGMVVDYVVHCSEAYLHAKAQDRVGRSKGMLGLVGMSVVSGSFSTVAGVAWMLLATIPFFFKFGTSILFQEATSLAYALIYYTALLSVAGPQNKDGDVVYDYYRIKGWCQWRYSMWCGDGSVEEPDWENPVPKKNDSEHSQTGEEAGRLVSEEHVSSEIRASGAAFGSRVKGGTMEETTGNEGITADAE